MRSLASIQEAHRDVSSWQYDDDESQDAQWRDGALVAFAHVLKKSDEERESQSLAAYNSAMKYQSYGDDMLDAHVCGVQETYLFCLNGITRHIVLTPEDVARLNANGCDHEFGWNGESDDKRNYIYVCPKCGQHET